MEFFKKHGGKRPGAGRPPLPEEEKRNQRTISVPDDPWQELLLQALQFDLTPGEYVEHLVMTEAGRRAREAFEAAQPPSPASPPAASS